MLRLKKNNSMNTKSILYSLFILLVLLSSCKTKKLLTQSETGVDFKLKEQVQKIQQAEPVFNTANVSKMSVAVEVSGRKFNTQASCKLRTDSAIHISIQPFLGFELFKVEINRDSMLVFDKVNKKLYPVPFAYFSQKFGLQVGFNDVQAMLSNRFFTVGSNIPNLAACKQIEEDGFTNIIAFFANEMTQKTYLNASNRIEKVALKTTKSEYNMLVSYGQFVNFETQIFPQTINIDASGGKRSVKFNFNISKVSFNSPLSFTNIDASRYTTADINQLLNK